jgi:energy-coupling factor transporter ATP-binding protein EcfA2
MQLLGDLHREGATICMVTHDPRFEKHAERIIHLFDGRIIEESLPTAGGDLILERRRPAGEFLGLLSGRTGRRHARPFPEILVPHHTGCGFQLILPCLAAKIVNEFLLTKIRLQM